MDIYSKATGSAGALSNFTAYAFVFDDVPCASMEGLLQSLLESNPEDQRQICQLVGLTAKEWGAKRLAQLGTTDRLWWKGKVYARSSGEYQELLNRMYEALATNREFRKALLQSGDEPLTHSIAKGEGPGETILIEDEFCSRLMRLRDRLQAESK